MAVLATCGAVFYNSNLPNARAASLIETSLSARNSSNAVPAQQITLDRELGGNSLTSISTTGTLKYKYDSATKRWYVYEDTTVSSYTLRNVSGTATLRFNNCGIDKNGKRVDAVITISNISVKMRWGTSFKTPVYCTVYSTGLTAGAGSWVSQSGHAISSAQTWRCQFFKSGTSTLAAGTFISGITDIDVNYSDNYPEAVKLSSGISSSVYVLPAAQRELVISESNTKFSAIKNGGDSGTYKTGLVYLGNADHTLQWTGSDCETSLFLSYYPTTSTASAGAGGTITMFGASKVGWKGTPSYTITAAQNYRIKSVKVGGSAISIPAGSKTYTYKFPPVYGDSTIAAEFEPVRANLIYNKNLDIATGATASQTGIAAGTKVPVSESGFSADGYTFKCWNTKPDRSGTDYLPGSEIAIGEQNVTLYAQWESIYHTVSWVDDTSGELVFSERIAHGADATAYAPPERTGWTLIMPELGEQNSELRKITKDKTFHIRYERNSYRVSVSYINKNSQREIVDDVSQDAAYESKFSASTFVSDLYMFLPEEISVENADTGEALSQEQVGQLLSVEGEGDAGKMSIEKMPAMNLEIKLYYDTWISMPETGSNDGLMLVVAGFGLVSVTLIAIFKRFRKQ